MIGTKKQRGSKIRMNRTRTAIFLASLILLGALAAFAVGSAAASGTAETETQYDTEASAVAVEQVQAQPGASPVLADDNVNIPPEAYFEDEDWGIFPEDGELEEGDGAVDIGITAQDLGADPGLLDFADGEITSFKFDVRYDSEKLELTDTQEAGIIDATVEEGPGSWEVDEYADGHVGLYWYLDIGFDEITDQLFGDDDDQPDIEFLEFDGDELVELTFEPTDEAEEGDVAEVEMLSNDIAHGDYDEPTVWGGYTGLSDYDTDNIWWGSGEIEVVPESVEPTLEGADGTFVAESTGGYIDFGQEDDPGEDEDTLATFPDRADENPIEIEGDFSSEDNEWKADPDEQEVNFPIIDAGDSNADTEVAFDDLVGGEIDIEDDEMTMEADTEVIVDLVDEDFGFEFEAVTGESGELEGDVDFSGVDPDTLEGTGEAQLVSNDFVVNEDEQEDVNDLRDEANLERDGDWVADEEGENYIVFDFEFEFEEFVGVESALEGDVVDESGDPLEDASVDIVDSAGDEIVTGSDGSFELGGLEPGTWDVRVNAEGYEPLEETITFEELETVEETFELEENDVNFEVEMEDTDDEIEEDESLFVRAEVANTEDGVDEQDIELLVDGDTVDSETVELGEEIEDDVTPDTFDTETDVDLEWDADGYDAGEYEVEVSSDNDADATDVEIVDEVAVDAIFDAELKQGSYVAFGVDSLDEAEDEDEHILLPPQEEGDDALVVNGQVTDEQWDASAGDIAFPDFEALGFGAEPDVPLGLEGTLDPESGEMTLEGEFEVEVPDVGATLQFDTDATTDDSGDMTGSADLSDDGGTVELVANEFEVPETGADVVDDQLEPPVPEGDSYLFLEMDVNIQDVDGPLTEGNVEGVVTDDAGNPVEGATVSIEDEPGEATTNEDGEYELTGVSTGTQELVIEAEAIEDDSVTVDVEEDETIEESVEVEGADPEFELSAEGDSAMAGDSLEIGGTVDNVGAGAGEVDVELWAETEDGEILIEETATEMLEGGESVDISETIETDEEMVGDGTATLEANGESDEADLEIDEPIEGGPDAFIEMSNTGDGYISFDEDNEDEAIEEGLEFPADEITIEGEVFDDQWQATAVEFPTLDADVTTAEVEASDIGGDIDTETGDMTLAGDLAVDVDLGGDPFEFGIDATTGDSGALSGSSDLADDGGSVTFVDNEYTVNDETGDGAVDTTLGLPIEDPGLAWIELSLDAELEDADDAGPTGDIEGEVTDEDGEPIEDATVDVVDETGDGTTDGDGEYSIERVDTGSYELAVDATGYEDATAEVDVEEDETVEQPFELEAGEPEFESEEVEVEEATPGETVTASATVTNTGNGIGTEEITFSVGDEEVTEEVELEPGEEEEVTVEWETDEDDAGTHAASLAVGDEEPEESEEVEVEDEEEPDNAILIEGDDGYVAFSQGSEGDAETDGLEIDGFTISGEIDEEDGTFEADDVSFENIDEPAEAAITSPDGFEGEIDTDTGELEMTGTLNADPVDLDEEFDFEVTLTTGESGDLSGDASFDSDAEEGDATLVANEFSVDETGGAAVDETLGLPSDTGESWLSLDADVSITTADEADAAGGGDGDGDGDGDEEEETEAEATFLTSLGLLGGIAGVGAAGLLLLVNLASRFMSAVDPDPDS